MKALFLFVGRVESVLANCTLAMLVAAVLWGVLTRYVTEKPAVWTTELSGILFTWVVFMGASAAFRSGHHIKVTLLVDTLPPKVATTIRFLAKLIVAAFLIYATYLAYLMMMKGATRLSPVLKIPFLWVYLATFLSFGMMSVITACRIFGLLPEPEEHLAEEVL